MSGGGGSSGVDRRYNARLAAIAERQQGMADEYFEFWRESGKPYEKAQLEANLELLPQEVETRKLGLETQKLGFETARKEMTAGTPVMEEYYKQALEGVDVGEEVQMARSDVAQGIQESEDATERTMSRLGVDPLSGRFADSMKATGMEKAKMVGGAMSGARRAAEDQNFQRLAGATQQFKTGGIKQ